MHDYITVYDMAGDRLSRNLSIEPEEGEHIYFIDGTPDKNRIVIITSGGDEKKYATKYGVRW